jgi:hypothetical protein
MKRRCCLSHDNVGEYPGLSPTSWPWQSPLQSETLARRMLDADHPKVTASTAVKGNRLGLPRRERAGCPPSFGPGGCRLCGGGVPGQDGPTCLHERTSSARPQDTSHVIRTQRAQSCRVGDAGRRADLRGPRSCRARTAIPLPATPTSPGTGADRGSLVVVRTRLASMNLREASS